MMIPVHKELWPGIQELALREAYSAIYFLVEVGIGEQVDGDDF